MLLGTDAGNTIFTRPNTTTTNNTGFGIRCQIGGGADGRLGTLNGNTGPENYVEGCVPSLQMTQYPPFKTIAREPRYDSLMRRMGLTNH